MKVQLIGAKLQNLPSVYTMNPLLDYFTTGFRSVYNFPNLHTMLATAQLTYQYPQRAPVVLPDLYVETGEHALILGASGSGKTTYLHLLAGLRGSLRGTVNFDSVDITLLKGRALDRFRGQHIGMVFQQPHLLGALSVLGNLQVATRMAGTPWDAQYAQSLLEALDIARLASQSVQRLSGGEAQRVAIARALINRPQVVLADEPTASLDDEACERVVQLLLTAAAQTGASLVMATHDQRVKAHFPQTLVL